ncbi:hypothetical protein QYM36_012139 [Artemia franciscana]|uniref:Uncharacterized protein n=2 Tax=Artemia franciscana TaxID=6661 RepID=A0AA88KZK9_ARTSF|nr:hypothetical protein QYM36_012139 [Artemia franciscana]
MKIKNLDGFLSDLLYDGSQIEPTILKAVWYLVAANCPPSHNASHQLLKILRNSGDLKEVCTDDIVILEWSHGCDLICQDLGRSTLRFFIEYGDSCHLPTDNSRIFESLMSIITSDCDKKAFEFAKMVLRSSERHSDYLAELICESLTKILLKSPKADYSLYALLKLLCECVEAETTKNRGLDERMVAIVVGNLPKVCEDDSIYIDIFSVACDFLQMCLLHAKEECANRSAMLIASEANFTKVLMDIFQTDTAKAKILNLVTTLAALLPPDFYCESSLLLDMDSLLSRLDNCPFEDMISGLQIFLLALKTNFNVSFVQFKVDDETLFFEVLLWKLENLAIKYSSIADDLIWVCIVEFLKLAHKKEFLEDMLSRETSLLHILKLKFDVNSLLDLPYECLLFINVLVYLTYRANDPPLNDEMKEVFEFIRNKASLTVKNMPCDFYQGSKSLFSEKDGSDLKFPIFREVANAFGIPL